MDPIIIKTIRDDEENSHVVLNTPSPYTQRGESLLLTNIRRGKRTRGGSGPVWQLFFGNLLVK